MVQARRDWAPPEIHDQDVGIAVTITADEPRLYNQVQQRVRQVQQRYAVASGYAGADSRSSASGETNAQPIPGIA
jgi:hypothetical protein